ncbi:MAG: hypothetical protein K6U88_15600 [Dehalococcoidia bacterium]|nr:hypothetical protein [Dehalococcoidia bacterium]
MKIANDTELARASGGYIGAPLARANAARLLAGRGRYVDDIHLPRTVHAAFVRSPHAHARIVSIETAAAAAAPGVVRIVTGAEVAQMCRPYVGVLAHIAGMRSAPQYPLAVSRACWQGEPVVAVLAETRAQAEDAAQLVEIEWEALAPVTDPETALDPGTPVLHVGSFPRGKGRLTPVEYVPPGELPDAEYPFLLTTGRSAFHYHAGSMTRHSASLLEKEGRAWVAVNDADALELGLREGDAVRVTSRRGTVVSRAHISSRLRKGNVFATFHFGEEGANLLTNPVLDPKSKIPELKVCAVRLERAEGGE